MLLLNIKLMSLKKQTDNSVKSDACPAQVKGDKC